MLFSAFFSFCLSSPPLLSRFTQGSGPTWPGQVPPDRLGSFSPSMARLQFKERAVRDPIHHYSEISPLKALALEMGPLLFHRLTFTGSSRSESLHWTGSASDGCSRTHRHTHSLVSGCLFPLLCDGWRPESTPPPRDLHRCILLHSR